MGIRRVVVVLALLALTLVLGACAAATDPATNVTPNGAILHAHGHSDSSPASYYFAYAPDRADLGTQAELQTKVVTVPAGVDGPNGEDLPFSARTVTLRPDTTYSYRVCGGDANIPFPTCANTRTFTTPPNPDVNLTTKEYGGCCVIATADFNRDGILDLANSNEVGPPFNQAVSVWFGNGNGGFLGPVRFGPNAESRELVAGDFNRDGKKDIAYNSSGVNVLLGDGNGGFSPGPQTSGGCFFTEARDVNRDGKLDLVGTSGIMLESWACVLFGDGAGGFSESSPIDADERPYSVTVGDITRDGRPDLVVGTAGPLGGPTGISVLPGTAAGGFGPPLHRSLPSGLALHIVVADFNRDGLLDVVASTATGQGPGPSYLLAGTPSGLPAAPVQVPNLPSSVLATGDLDGNGTQDLIAERTEDVAPNGGGRSQLIFRVLPGKGDGTFKAPNDTPAVLPDRPSAFSSSSLLVADFDRDGREDLATAGEYLSDVTGFGFMAVGLNRTAP